MKRIFLFATLLFPAVLKGAGAPDAVVDADTLFYQLQAIEVLATHSDASEKATVTTMSSERIARDNYGYDMPSILMFTPSLVSTSESGMGTGGGSISIRGVDATRINVNINGMPLNDPDSHAMYWYDTPDIAASVSSISVVRGADIGASGTASLGASVNMASSALKEEFCGDASVSLGSYNTSRQSVHVGSGLMSGRWVVDARASHSSTDGYIDRASSDMKSYMLQAGYFNGGTMLKLLSFGGLAKTYLTYEGVSPEDIENYGRTYHTSGQYRTSDGPYSLADGTRVAYFDDHTDNYLQINNQFILDHSFSSRWKMGAMLHYTYGYGYYRQYKDDASLCEYDNFMPAGTQTDVIRRKHMRSNTVGAAANASFRGRKVDVVFGASYMLYFCPHFGTLDWIDGVPEDTYRDFRWYDNDVRKSDAGVYAKARYTLADGLVLSAGIQYRSVGYRTWGSNDNYDWQTGFMQPVSVDRRWNFLNPSLGIRYDIDSRHSVCGSFTIANKEPTRSDFCDRYKFSSLEGEPESERLADWEASYGFKSEMLEAGVNLYYMKYHNQLIPTGIMNDSEDMLNMNVRDSYRAGAELSLKVLPLKWLNFGAYCTLSRSKAKNFDEIIGNLSFHHDEADIAYSPSIIASAFANAEFAGMDVLIRAQYVGKQYIAVGGYDDLSLGGYFVANADFGYTLPQSLAGCKIRFGLRISNFTGSRYCAYGYGGSYIDDSGERKSWMRLFPQAPCNVIGNVMISF